MSPVDRSNCESEKPAGIIPHSLGGTYSAIIRGVSGYAWYDFVGNLGVAIIVVTYLLMQLGRLDGAGLAYASLNAVGATFVLVSLLFEFNLSAFVVETFWVLISLVGIVRRLGAAKPAV